MLRKETNGTTLNKMVQTGTEKYLEVSYEMATKMVVARKRVEAFCPQNHIRHE
jgi:hypothetical protein